MELKINVNLYGFSILSEAVKKGICSFSIPTSLFAKDFTPTMGASSVDTASVTDKVSTKLTSPIRG